MSVLSTVFLPMVAAASGGDIVPSEGSATTMDGLITNLTTAVKGIYGIAGAGFDFIANNVLCLLMVGLSFAGAGLGLVGRAFKTSRR